MENLNIKYKFDKNYNPKYANGVIGGVNPLGEVVMNFFLERRPIPKSTEVKLEGGLPTDIINSFEPDDYDKSMIRFIENGIILNYQTAKELHRWLGDHLKQIENQ